MCFLCKRYFFWLDVCSSQDTRSLCGARCRVLNATEPQWGLRVDSECPIYLNIMANTTLPRPAWMGRSEVNFGGVWEGADWKECCFHQPAHASNHCAHKQYLNTHNIEHKLGYFRIYDLPTAMVFALSKWSRSASCYFLVNGEIPRLTCMYLRLLRLHF